MNGREGGWHDVVEAIQHEAIMSAVAHTTDPRADPVCEPVVCGSGSPKGFPRAKHESKGVTKVEFGVAA